MNYRRAVKQAISNAMFLEQRVSKIQLSGRLNGAEMARSEMFKEAVHHSTLSPCFDIDYALERHVLRWCYRCGMGMPRWSAVEKRDLAPDFSHNSVTIAHVEIVVVVVVVVAIEQIVVHATTANQ